MNRLPKRDPFGPTPRNPFRDNWEDDFDKNFNRAFKWGVRAWVVAMLVGIAFWVVVIWAIVQGVQWLQTQ